MTTSRLTSHTRPARRGPALIGSLVLAAAFAAPTLSAAPSTEQGAAPITTATRPGALRVQRLIPPHRYDWPLKPFGKQHPVRAFFGDPRIGPTPHGLAHNFHFGIDIHGANGAPVYATINGRVVLESFRPETVTVVGDDGLTEFEYWHVTAEVRNGQRVRANRTVVGRISRWQHVHFSEVRNGRYVNPLRAGALGPYIDHTRPVAKDFRVEREGRVVRAGRARGRVDLVVEAYDAVPMALPEPWSGNPVVPARLRWRLRGERAKVTTWQTAIDFRWGIPANDAYSTVYARWSRQNKRARTGRYRFYLAHDWDSRVIPNGRYEVEVDATDTMGNTSITRFPITVVNGI